MDKEFIKDYSWVKSGSQRIKIIISLIKPMTPKEIQKNTKLKFSNVSDCLKSLNEKKLVICLNPENHLGRLYVLTEEGEKIQNFLLK